MFAQKMTLPHSKEETNLNKEPKLEPECTKKVDWLDYEVKHYAIYTVRTGEEVNCTVEMSNNL